MIQQAQIVGITDSDFSLFLIENLSRKLYFDLTKSLVMRFFRTC